MRLWIAKREIAESNAWNTAREKFYRDLSTQGKQVRVGMEASGHARWFERLLEELNIELWMGDAAVIRAKRGRKPKTDRQDADMF